MKLLRTFIGLILLGLLGACVASLHPLYTEQELVQNDVLVGTWKTEEESWTFKKDKFLPNGYQLLHIYNNNLSYFDAHLVRLEDHLYLNIYPSSMPESDVNYLFNMHRLLLNTFSKIKIEPNALTLSSMDGELLEKRLEDQTIHVDHFYSPDGALILTADTKELQDFVINNDTMFTDPMVLKRVSSSLSFSSYR